MVEAGAKGASENQIENWFANQAPAQISAAPSANRAFVRIIESEKPEAERTK
jgi:hypothetical protein